MSQTDNKSLEANSNNSPAKDNVTKHANHEVLSIKKENEKRGKLESNTCEGNDESDVKRVKLDVGVCCVKCFLL